jgi:hypothetical protein
MGVGVETAGGNAIDDAVNEEVKRMQDKVDYGGINNKREFLLLGRDRATCVVDAYIASDPELSDTDSADLMKEVRGAYFDGVVAMDQLDKDDR